MKLNNTNYSVKVPLYIIVLIVAIPQFSETIYVPSLPDLAKDLVISANLAEYTLTIYLFGFATGVLIWGNCSDYYGRKPILLCGFIIYALSSLACYFAANIYMLLAARFMQALGASVGSVLGQAIARDVIKPEDRGRMFSIVGIAMAFAPALGPIIGGFVVKFYHWSAVFLVLIGVAIFMIFILCLRLPETNLKLHTKRSIIPLYKQCFLQMINDKRLIGFAFLVGSVNGVLFGYFAEAPFYFIEGLQLSTSSFGIVAFFICGPLALGGMISKKLHRLQMSSDNIISVAIKLMCFGSLTFFLSNYFGLVEKTNMVAALILTLLWITVIITGLAMIIPNCLSQALENYGNFAGTAASLFGFTYYLIIAGFTALIGYMHDGSLIQLPLYMLIISISMWTVFSLMVSKKTV